MSNTELKVNDFICIRETQLICEVRRNSHFFITVLIYWKNILHVPDRILKEGEFKAGEVDNLEEKKILVFGLDSLELGYESYSSE